MFNIFYSHKVHTRTYDKIKLHIIKILMSTEENNFYVKCLINNGLPVTLFFINGIHVYVKMTV